MKTRSVLPAFVFILQGSAALAAEESSTPAIGGYDAVAFQTENRAVRGSGMFVSKYEDLTYLFASEANQKRFDRSPATYVPAYGGWCAYGASLGKKFHPDPTVFCGGRRQDLSQPESGHPAQMGGPTEKERQEGRCGVAADPGHGGSGSLAPGTKPAGAPGPGPKSTAAGARYRQAQIS